MFLAVLSSFSVVDVSYVTTYLAMRVQLTVNTRDPGRYIKFTLIIAAGPPSVTFPGLQT